MEIPAFRCATLRCCAPSWLANVSGLAAVTGDTGSAGGFPYTHRVPYGVARWWLYYHATGNYLYYTPKEISAIGYSDASEVAFAGAESVTVVVPNAGTAWTEISCYDYSGALGTTYNAVAAYAPIKLGSSNTTVYFANQWYFVEHNTESPTAVPHQTFTFPAPPVPTLADPVPPGVQRVKARLVKRGLLWRLRHGVR